MVSMFPPFFSPSSFSVRFFCFLSDVVIGFFAASSPLTPQRKLNGKETTKKQEYQKKGKMLRRKRKTRKTNTPDKVTNVQHEKKKTRRRRRRWKQRKES